MATQTAKKTPAPAAPTAAKETPKLKPVELDFSAMTVQDAPDDDLTHERGSKYDNSPVKDWLSESYQNDKAKQIPVPSKAHADALEQALRAVAARLKIGVKILTKPVDASKPEDAQIVKFLGKEKRAYQPKDNKTTA